MTNANLIFDVEYVDASSVIPQGASAVPSDQSYYVDPNIWEIQDTAGGSTTPQPTPTASTGSSPPPFPSPSCNPNASGGFDLNACHSPRLFLYPTNSYRASRLTTDLAVISWRARPRGNILNTIHPFVGRVSERLSGESFP